MKIFLAFPFTQLMDDKGIVKEDYIKLLDEARNLILQQGHEVFLAHYREEWGEKLMGPYECTPDDYNEMKNADFVIAFPGWPISGGVHVELGWASAHSKKIALILDKNGDYSPLVVGLGTVTDTEIYYYDRLEWDAVKEIFNKVIPVGVNE